MVKCQYEGRCPSSGYSIFALRIGQEFAEYFRAAGSRIAREAYAGSAIEFRIAKYHSLKGHCGPQLIGIS